MTIALRRMRLPEWSRQDVELLIARAAAWGLITLAAIAAGRLARAVVLAIISRMN